MDYGSRQWLEAAYARSADDPWGLDWRPSQQVRYQRMIDVLAHARAEGHRFERIVDIGCATGAFTARLAAVAEGGERALVGLDIAQAAVARARIRHPGIRFECLQADAYAAQAPGEADLVVALEVLYYLPDPAREAMLAAAARMLRPGGLLLASSMIARPPYLTLAQLRSLVERGFELRDSGALGLRALNAFERLAMRGMRALGRPDGRWLSPARLPAAIARARRLEALSSRLLGAAAWSHGYVLARKAAAPIAPRV
jgi:SAM-dependent methyltransferase